MKFITTVVFGLPNEEDYPITAEWDVFPTVYLSCIRGDKAVRRVHVRRMCA